MSEATHTIGEIARRAGLKSSAIRYYERAGLLPKPERVSGQRRYSDEITQRLGVIDTAKQAGFNLDEIRVLLDASDAGSPAHEQLQALAARKLPEVRTLISRAEAMRDWLTLASRCDCDTLDACGLFDGAAERDTGVTLSISHVGGHPLTGR